MSHPASHDADDPSLARSYVLVLAIEVVVVVLLWLLGRLYS